MVYYSKDNYILLCRKIPESWYWNHGQISTPIYPFYTKPIPIFGENRQVLYLFWPKTQVCIIVDWYYTIWTLRTIRFTYDHRKHVKRSLACFTRPSSTTACMVWLRNCSRAKRHNDVVLLLTRAQ